MFTYTPKFINSNGIKLHYYRTGGHKPALVLAHGITDDGLCWTHLAETLADDFDVIMVDARGHGRSEAPDGGYNMSTLADDLAGVLQGLQLKQPILLGHSMGAITVLTLAGKYPDFPGAILLEDPPPFWVPQKPISDDQKNNNPLLGWIKSLKRQTYADLLAAARANSTWAEVEFEPWINSKHRFSPKIGALASTPDLSTLDYASLMQRVSCPVLFLRADPELGSIATESDIATLNQWIKQLQVVHISGAGHNIRREQFDAYLSAVKNFLSSLKSR
jgi:N-formylmaleamate deformylase